MIQDGSHDFVNDTKFRKCERLLKRADFKHVERKGVRLKSPRFIAFVYRNDLDWNRLGITVTRKVGRAPYRNWWKRRIREVFRTHKSRVGVGFDMVVIVKAKSTTPTFKEIQEELLDIWDKVHSREQNVE